MAKLRLKTEKREKKDKFDAPASFLQSLRRILTMSESGEISEFGYIMELLARGKAGRTGKCESPAVRRDSSVPRKRETVFCSWSFEKRLWHR